METTDHRGTMDGKSRGLQSRKPVFLVSIMEFVNCTPHDITVLAEDGTTILLHVPKADPPIVLRVEESESKSAGMLGNVPILDPPTYGGVTGRPLPGAKDGAWPPLLVSQLVGKALSDYPGAVYGPHTGPAYAVRKEGRIVGTKALIRYKKAS